MPGGRGDRGREEERQTDEWGGEANRERWRSRVFGQKGGGIETGEEIRNGGMKKEGREKEEETQRGGGGGGEDRKID